MSKSKFPFSSTPNLGWSTTTATAATTAAPWSTPTPGGPSQGSRARCVRRSGIRACFFGYMDVSSLLTIYPWLQLPWKYIIRNFEIGITQIYNYCNKDISSRTTGNMQVNNWLCFEFKNCKYVNWLSKEKTGFKCMLRIYWHGNSLSLGQPFWNCL